MYEDIFSHQELFLFDIVAYRTNWENKYDVFLVTFNSNELCWCSNVKHDSMWIFGDMCIIFFIYLYVLNIID